MDGYAELYYRTEADYKVKRNEVLPYAVNCKEYNNIGILVNTLKEAGFSFVLETSGTPSLMTTFLGSSGFSVN